MTVIKVSCPTCGDVDLTNHDIVLRVCDRPASHYLFVCPYCNQRISKPADDHIVRLLLSGGVRGEHWVVPAEVLEVKTGPALTYDDLLDLVLDLERDDVLVNP